MWVGGRERERSGVSERDGGFFYERGKMKEGKMQEKQDPKSQTPGNLGKVGQCVCALCVH